MQIPVSAKNAKGMSFLLEQRRDRDQQREERDRDHRVERHPVAVDPAEDPPAGIPRSRENAYQVREALVNPAVTQKIWPIVAIMMTSFAAQESSALVKIATERRPRR